MRGMTLEQAASLAVEFVLACIDATARDPQAGWYGVEFEKALPLLEPKMSPGGVILCESALDEALPPKVGAFQIKKEYRYGKIKLTAYRIPEQNATEE